MEKNIKMNSKTEEFRALKSIDELIEFIKLLATDKDTVTFISDLFNIINKLDIFFNYETNKTFISRLVLRIKKTTKCNPFIYYLCNGCVIDCIKWKALSIPPIAFNRSFSHEIIDKFMSQDMYDIFKVIDGTIVTFYYYNDKWNISTRNAYDVSSYYWIGEMTYSEVLYDLFSRLYPESISKNGIKLIDKYSLDFDLPTNHCYTVGFRHHNFHPLLLDPECVWNIQCINLENGKVKFETGLNGIPGQLKVNADISLEINSISKMISFNKLAINNATKIKPTFNYGFILRSKNNDICDKFSSILVESPLLRKIKKHIYDYPPVIIGQFINHSNRIDYVIIKNYFNKQEKNDILQLYPQFNKLYVKLNKSIVNTIQCIITIMKNKQSNSNILLNFQPCIVTLSYILIKYISKIEVIDPFNKDSESIIRDYISNVEYIVLYINMIDKYKE
jgi:hypothetical protein